MEMNQIVLLVLLKVVLLLGGLLVWQRLKISWQRSVVKEQISHCEARATALCRSAAQLRVASFQQLLQEGRLRPEYELAKVRKAAEGDFLGFLSAVSSFNAYCAETEESVGAAKIVAA